MPAATPHITLTAKLLDLSNVAAGTAPNPARLQITLCGYGLTLPQIVGTGTLAKVGPYQLEDSGAGISLVLWGNDQITPIDTFYTIAVLDGDGNAVQCGRYRFSGGPLTIDLSNAPQITPTNSLAYVPLLGTIPGRVFTAPGLILALAYNGELQSTDQYDLDSTGTQATLNFATEEGDTVQAFVVVQSASALVPGSWLMRWQQAPGAVPGTVFTAPQPCVAATKNGNLLRPLTDYSLSADGLTITLTTATVAGDVIFALCAA